MRHRSNWLTLLASAVTSTLLVVGVVVPDALAKKPDPPKNTQLPNGRPFQLIQEMIDGLDDRIEALEAAAPEAGTMWINPFDFSGTLGNVTLVPAGAAAPGLVVGALGIAVDTLQAGLQVPLGFAITGATVCYAPGTGGFVSSVALAKNNPTPPFGSSVLATAPVGSPGTPVCASVTLGTPYDPSTGGPAYLAIGVSFSGLGLDSLTIRGIGILLAPIGGP
jgi:hypothetical protein